MQNKGGTGTFDRQHLGGFGTMIALTLTALFVTVAIATLITLADCWLRGRAAFAILSRERALAQAGFVPMAESSEIRLRGRKRSAPAATRPFAQRLPEARPARVLAVA